MIALTRLKTGERIAAIGSICQITKGERGTKVLSAIRNFPRGEGCLWQYIKVKNKIPSITTEDKISVYIIFCMNLFLFRYF